MSKKKKKDEAMIYNISESMLMIDFNHKKHKEFLEKMWGIWINTSLNDQYIEIPFKDEDILDYLQYYFKLLYNNSTGIRNYHIMYNTDLDIRYEVTRIVLRFKDDDYKRTFKYCDCLPHKLEIKPKGYCVTFKIVNTD